MVRLLLRLPRLWAPQNGAVVLALVWSVACGGAESAAQPAPAAPLAAAPREERGGDIQAREGQAVASFWTELAWTAPSSTSCTISLRLGVQLSAVPEDWLQISARVPEGYCIRQYKPGEWVPFYFMTHSPRADVELRLERSGPDPGVVDFPVLVQVGSWRQWLRVYLRGSAEGHAAVVLLVDGGGQPLWFPGSHSRGPAGSGPSFWALATTVGDSLAFLSTVLDIQVEAPGYLSPWCGMSISASTLDELLDQVCWRAGCRAERIGDGRYVVSFDPTYRGAPDASWFVVREGDSLWCHAESAPAIAIIPAIVEAAGGTMGDSPDLLWSRVSRDWKGPLAGLLAVVCDAARPPLKTELRNGAHYFHLARASERL